MDGRVLDLVLPSEQNCKDAKSPHLPGDRGDLMPAPPPKCEYGAGESSDPAQHLPEPALRSGTFCCSLPPFLDFDCVSVDLRGGGGQLSLWKTICCCFCSAVWFYFTGQAFLGSACGKCQQPGSRPPGMPVEGNRGWH